MFEFILAVLPGTISIGVIFLLGCIGETIGEKSGSLNLGIPGVMCFGAVGGALGSMIYMNTIYKVMPVDFASGFTFSMLISYLLLIIFGLVFAFGFGAIGGLIFAFLTTTLKANQNVAGLALTTFGAGVGDFIMNIINTSFVGANVASKIIKTGLPDYGILVYITFALAVVVYFVVAKTRVGLSLRSVGENPATADAAGINTDAYKYWASIIGCGIAGLGGYFYIMSHNSGTWENSGTLQGFGWLALALVIFSVWNPLIGVAGSLVFGFLSICQAYIKGLNTFQMQIFSIMPYAVTIIVLVIASIIGKKKVAPPEALGQNYFREER